MCSVSVNAAMKQCSIVTFMQNVSREVAFCEDCMVYELPVQSDPSCLLICLFMPFLPSSFLSVVYPKQHTPFHVNARLFEEPGVGGMSVCMLITNVTRSMKLPVCMYVNKGLYMYAIYNIKAHLQSGSVTENSILM